MVDKPKKAITVGQQGIIRGSICFSEVHQELHQVSKASK
jgi:hypothetical protein